MAEAVDDNLEEVADESEEDNDDTDDDDDDADLEDVKVALKPRCNLFSTIKEIRSNEKIGSIEFDIYKNFLKEAADDEVEGLFEAVGRAASLRKLTIVSKGSATQTLPVSLLANCLGEASGLRELRLLHVKWRGDMDDFDDLAAALTDHSSLRVLQLHVEALDHLESSIASVGHIPSIREVEIHTAMAAADKAGITTALQSLCTSKSLRVLRLVHVTVKFDILSSVAPLLSANDTLQELFIQASELDLNGGMAMAQMLTANGGLRKFVLQLDKMHRSKLAEEFVQALEMNDSVQHFQIMLDGRMSDMKVVRNMQLMFRNALKGKYKVSSQVGLSMGVTCERKE